MLITESPSTLYSSLVFCIRISEIVAIDIPQLSLDVSLTLVRLLLLVVVGGSGGHVMR